MISRILKLLAILAVGLLALRAYAHQIECEKEVGIVQLDAQGRVVLGTDGLPVFTTPPSTVLTLETYPVAIGWRIQVNNLTTETSVVSGFQDPVLATSVQVFGTLPAPGVEIAVGGAIDAVVVQRIGSFEECAGRPPPANIAASVLEGGGGPVCRDVRENVALVTTHADATGCRAKIDCKPPPRPCRTVAGIDWCYNSQLCGVGCEAVCASLGREITISDAAWFAAQDTQAECDAIAGAFGLPGELGGFVFGCLEDNGQGTLGPRTSGQLLPTIICSTLPTCPATHRVSSDQAGIACNTPGVPTALSICPCTAVPP